MLLKVQLYENQDITCRGLSSKCRTSIRSDLTRYRDKLVADQCVYCRKFRFCVADRSEWMPDMRYC